MLNEKDFKRFPKQNESTKLFILRNLIEEVIEKDLIQSDIYPNNAADNKKQDNVADAIKELKNIIDLIDECEAED